MDEKALAQALKEGRIRGAALDVHESEPFRCVRSHEKYQENQLEEIVCVHLLITLFPPSFAVEQLFPRSPKRRPQLDLHAPHRLVQRAGVAGDERGRRNRNTQSHHRYGDMSDCTHSHIHIFWFLGSPVFNLAPSTPKQAVFLTASETASTKSSLLPRHPGE